MREKRETPVLHSGFYFMAGAPTNNTARPEAVHHRTFFLYCFLEQTAVNCLAAVFPRNDETLVYV